MNHVLQKYLRFACISGLLFGAVNTIQGQSRQIRLGDNMGDQIASKDLEMSNRLIRNTSGIAIGVATITNNSIALQVDGTDKAILIPRIMSLTAIVSPENGMMVYNTADNKLYVRQGNVWTSFADGSGSVVSMNGKIGAVTFEGDETTITVNNTGAKILVSAKNATAIWNANKLNGNSVSTSNPVSGQVLGWDGTQWLPVDMKATTALLVTNPVQSAITSLGTLTGLTVTAPIAASVTGNAATATKLATPRSINGVAFDGTADITLPGTSDAVALTGTTLNPSIVNSSLTSLGTLTGLTVTNPIAGSILGNAATATNAASAAKLTTPKTINGIAFDGTANITLPVDASGITGTDLPSNIVKSSLTSVGTLTGLTVTAPIAGSVAGNAATATSLATPRNINGVPFNGTADITISAAAAAADLTGATLATNVVSSSLTSVGTLANLTVTNPIAGSITGNAATVTTNANLTGEVTSTGNATSIANSAVISKVLTGYASGAGTISATDNILQAIQKIDGNDALKAPLASPTFTGTPTLPTGTIAVTQAPGDNTTKVATTAFVREATAAGTVDADAITKGKIQLAGDITGTAALPTIATNAITSAKIADGTILSVDIADGSVGLSKQGDIATSSLIGRSAVGNGAPEVLTVAAVKSMLSLSKVDVGLGNVNNTADADKPISSTTQTALNAKAATADLDLKAPLASPTFTGTVNGITSAMVGLGNVNNTADADKPISSATQTALNAKAATADLDLKAPLASPALSGTPTAPTAAALTSTTQVATTEFVTTANALKANLASPTFTGTPTLPTGTIATTQTAGNNTTAIATTEFVTIADNLKANLVSPALTGVPTAPTAAPNTNNTQVATTAFVTTLVMAEVPKYARLTTTLMDEASTSLVDIAGLTQTLAANSVYEFEAVLTTQVSTVTAGTGYGVNLSSELGATISAVISGSVTTTSGKTDRISTFNSAASGFMTAASQSGGIIIKGIITTGSTAPMLSIKHRNTSSGSTNTVFAGSYLKVTKIP